MTPTYITQEEGPPRFGEGVEPGEYEITIKYKGDQGAFELTSNVACLITKSWVNEKSVSDVAATMFRDLQGHIHSPISRVVQSIARS